MEKNSIVNKCIKINIHYVLYELKSMFLFTLKQFLLKRKKLALNRQSMKICTMILKKSSVFVTLLCIIIMVIFQCYFSIVNKKQKTV